MTKREIDKNWRWLKQRFLDKREGVMQARDKEDERRFDVLISAGLVELYDASFGFYYYEFTRAGRKRWLSA